MYCINCGIEMSEGQKVCPICQTKVYHPDFLKSDALPTYPQKPFKADEINIRGLLFVVTLLHLIPIIFALILDLNLNGAFDWTGYVVGSILLIYTASVFPRWFKRINPIVVVSLEFMVLEVFLWYINYTLGQGWFFTLAFPVAAIAYLITVGMMLGFKYLKGRGLLVMGGGFLLMGVFTLLIEFFMHLTLEVAHTGYAWSWYPMVFLAILGIGLIVIELVKPFKESLRKMFFL